MDGDSGRERPLLHRGDRSPRRLGPRPRQRWARADRATLADAETDRVAAPLDLADDASLGIPGAVAFAGADALAVAVTVTANAPDRTAEPLTDTNGNPDAGDVDDAEVTETSQTGR